MCRSSPTCGTCCCSSRRARRSCAAARRREAGGALPEEFLLADLQEGLERLQEITGRRTSDDLLRHIFERFCIGK